ARAWPPRRASTSRCRRGSWSSPLSYPRCSGGWCGRSPGRTLTASGITRSRPPTAPGSSSSPSSATERPPAASGLALATGVDLLHLLLGPGDRLVGRHLARRVLGEHVGDDVEVEHLLGRRRRRTRPGGRHRHFGDLGDEPVLLVALVHGVLGQVR